MNKNINYGVMNVNKKKYYQKNPQTRNVHNPNQDKKQQNDKKPGKTISKKIQQTPSVAKVKVISNPPKNDIKSNNTLAISRNQKIKLEFYSSVSINKNDKIKSNVFTKNTSKPKPLQKQQVNKPKCKQNKNLKIRKQMHDQISPFRQQVLINKQHKHQHETIQNKQGINQKANYLLRANFEQKQKQYKSIISKLQINLGHSEQQKKDLLQTIQQLQFKISQQQSKHHKNKIEEQTYQRQRQKIFTQKIKTLTQHLQKVLAQNDYLKSSTISNKKLSSQNKSLKQTLTNYQTKIESLKNQLNKQKHLNQSLLKSSQQAQTLFNQQNQQLKQLQKKLTQKQSIIQTNKQTITNKNQQIHQLNNTLADNESVIESLIKDKNKIISQANAEISKMKQSFHTKLQQVQTQFKTNNKMQSKKQIIQNQKKIKDLQKKIREHQKSISQYKQIKQIYQNTIKTHEQSFLSINKKNKLQINRQTQALKQQINKLQNQLSKIRGQKQFLERKIQRVQKQQKDKSKKLQAQNNSLKQKLTNYETKIQNYQTKIANDEKQLNKYQNDNQDLLKSFKQVQTHSNRYNQEFNKLQRQLKQKESIIETHKQKIAKQAQTLKQEINKLQNQLFRINNEKQILSNKLQRVQQDYRGLLLESQSQAINIQKKQTQRNKQVESKQQAAIDKLTQQIFQLNKQITQKQMKFTQQQKLTKNLLQQKNTLLNQVQSSKIDKIQLTNQLNSHNIYSSQVDQYINKFTQQIVRLREEIQADKISNNQKQYSSNSSQLIKIKEKNIHPQISTLFCHFNKQLCLLIKTVKSRIQSITHKLNEQKSGHKSKLIIDNPQKSLSHIMTNNKNSFTFMYFNGQIIKTQPQKISCIVHIVQKNTQKQIRSTKMIFRKNMESSNLALKIKKILTTSDSLSNAILILFRSKAQRTFAIFCHKEQENKFTTVLINVDTEKYFGPAKETSKNGFTEYNGGMNVVFGADEVKLKNSSPGELIVDFDVNGEKYFEIEDGLLFTGQKSQKVLLQEAELHEIQMKNF